MKQESPEISNDGDGYESSRTEFLESVPLTSDDSLEFNPNHFTMTSTQVEIIIPNKN